MTQNRGTNRFHRGIATGIYGKGVIGPNKEVFADEDGYYRADRQFQRRQRTGGFFAEATARVAEMAVIAMPRKKKLYLGAESTHSNCVVVAVHT